MSYHLQLPLTNTPKPDISNSSKPGSTETNPNHVSLQAESIVNSLAFPMVFKAALELGVIDAIAAADDATWLSPSEIALRLPTKPNNPEAPVLLDRMLRLLVSHSILKHRVVETGQNGQTERVYAIEPVCKFFLIDNDGSGSLAPLFLLHNHEILFKAWTHLTDLILEGKDAFESAHGMKLFEFLGADALYAQWFNLTMSEPSNLIMKKVLEVYKGFENANILVDVGGGIGTVLSLITSKYPNIKGVNFDLPQILTHAPNYPGVEHVPGDMFVEIPKGDVIFMKWILHDWTDEKCITILQNCWKNLPEKGKVIIVEMLVPTQPKSGDVSSSIVFGMDMLMLTQCSSGKERSLSQFEALAFDSGFSRCEIICFAYSYAVIELHK